MYCTTTFLKNVVSVISTKGTSLFVFVCSRSSHCALYLQGMEEGSEDNSKLGEASCVTRFIRMLLSLVSFIIVKLSGYFITLS